MLWLKVQRSRFSERQPQILWGCECGSGAGRWGDHGDVTRGRWDCVGDFLCTDVSSSVPVWGLWQSLCECPWTSVHVGRQCPWLTGDMVRVPAYGRVGPGFLGPPIEHWLWAVLWLQSEILRPVTAKWVDPQSHSFLGKNNSAISPTNEWAGSVSCVFEGWCTMKSEPYRVVRHLGQMPILWLGTLRIRG